MNWQGRESIFIIRFEEAHITQLEVQKSISKDREICDDQFNKKLDSKFKEIEDLHSAEEGAFYIKSQETKNKLEKQRSDEIEGFNKKYKIIFADVINRQNAEKKQLEKNVSVTMTMSQALTSKMPTKSQIK